VAWPKELNICGKRYAVVYCGKMSDVDPSGEEMLWGWHSSIRREVRIFAECSEEDRWDTLFHEAIHAIMDEYATLKAALGDNEEAFVSEFASAWVDFTRRNKLTGG
jgi:hypothetical protein